MSNEPIIYQDRNVTVTTSRVTFADKTYALANITSVGTGKTTASQLLAWTLILLGGGSALLFAIMWQTMPSNTTCAVGSGICFVVGLLLYRSQSKKVTYTVVLGSSSGETQAMSSPNASYIQQVAQAIRDAIVQRG